MRSLKSLIASMVFMWACGAYTADAKTVPHKTIAHLHFNKVVDDDSAAELIKKIDAANDLHVQTILLELNTPGGSVTAGFDMAKAIEDSAAPVVCVVDNSAFSEGFYILQACKTRIMTYRSIIMLHYMTISEVSGSVHDLNQTLDMLQKMQLQWLAHSVRRMNITPEEALAKLDHYAWWMLPFEAVETGAVDCEVDSVKQVENSLVHGLPVCGVTNTEH